MKIKNGSELQSPNDELIERLNKSFENITDIAEKMSVLDSSFVSNQDLLVNKISEISLSNL